jgi:PKD repeat protein
MFMAEMFVDVDPGEGNGIPIDAADGFWGNDTTELLAGPIDFSTYDVGVYEVYVRTAENHTLLGMGSVVWGAPMNVTIEVVDNPPIADAGPDQTVPQHTLVTFDGSGSTDDVGITNYWWNFTDGVPVTLPGVAPTHTFDFEGIYNVTLTVMDRMGQTDSDNMIVNVTDGDPPVADAGPDQFDVPGATINFDGSNSFDPGHLGEPIDDGIVNWTWDFTDGVPVQYFGPTPSHTFLNPGTYPVTLTVTDQVGLTDTDEMNVTIYQIFDIDVTQAPLSNGWILISFPNQVEGDPLTIISDLNGDTTWDIAQWYDPTDVGNEWKTTATFKPPVLNDFTYVNNTYGFWIHIDNIGDGFIRMVGDLAASGEMAVYNLKTGWNLVGYPFAVGQPAANTFGTAFSIADAMAYDPVDPYRLRFYDWFMENHDPGQGYFVFCLGDEDLYVWAP